MNEKSLSALPLLLVLATAASAGVNFFNPTVPSAVPESMSATGIYSSIVNKTLDTAAKYFEVNAALWSDAAHKDRWIILPPGTKITYVDTTDVFVYPENTIFVKLFRHDTVAGDSNSRIYWETRLLVKKSGLGEEWHGFSYRWNKAGTEATLVSREFGLDTVLFLPQAPYYRKWRFPTSVECTECHQVAPEGRAVLGFFPAQLKRVSRVTVGGNQVTDLYNAGVFSNLPTALELTRRWRGISEGIPAGLSATERFKVIDTMARAYIAANCSGCHGTRGLALGATDRAPYLNYDFYNYQPVMQFDYQGTSPFGLDLSDAHLEVGDTTVTPSGRWQFLNTLQEWGVNTAPGSSMDATRPSAGAFPSGVQPGPYLIVPGYPAYSTLLFRQVARRTAASDSGFWFRALGAGEAGSPQWKSWLFKSKWGSKAWRDTLAGRAGTGANLNVIFGALYGWDGGQMPPLATHIPDTAALKVLGEWARTYQPTPLAIRNARITRQDQMPIIRNRQVIVPEGWAGKAVMTGIDGRSWVLPTVGRGRYALPALVPMGVYLFRIGDRSFRTSVMR
jgi:hypothetical protein